MEAVITAVHDSKVSRAKKMFRNSIPEARSKVAAGEENELLGELGSQVASVRVRGGEINYL